MTNRCHHLFGLTQYLEPKGTSCSLLTHVLELFLLSFCMENEKRLPLWEMVVILGSAFVAVGRVGSSSLDGISPF
jgi:hypothetical protein